MEASFLGKAPRFLTVAPPRLPLTSTIKALPLAAFPIILHPSSLMTLRRPLFLLLVPGTAALRHFCRPVSTRTYASTARSFLFIPRVLD